MAPKRAPLWHGPGSDADTSRDVLKIVIPAALQAIPQTFRSVLGASGLSLRGFESSRITEFFPRHRTAPGWWCIATSARSRRHNVASDSSHVLVLERLLDLYRITNAKIDLKGF